MELIQTYLDDVMKVDGKWILQVPDNLDPDVMEDIEEGWRQACPGESLIILPKEISIHKRNKYSFYIALMIVKMGHRVTRLDWRLRSRSFKDAPVLMMSEVEGTDQKVLIKSYPDDHEEDEFYLATEEDMDAEDYILAPKGD
jgi:hypothetical protein